MEILIRKQKATAREVMGDLEDPTSYSAVRGILSLLVDKGHVQFSSEKNRHVYEPLIDSETIGRSALKALLSNVFKGRPDKLVASLLSLEDRKLSAEELEKIRKLIN